jgi:membrane-associated phospholipid phosphatase
VGRASDYAVAVGIATGLGLTQLTEIGHGAHGLAALRAPVVVAEGAMAGSALVQLFKNVLGVCRPRDWREAERRCSEDGESDTDPKERRNEAHRSFPSGHNAPLAGMAGAAFGLYLLPSNHRPEYLPVALTSLGFAFSTVLLRVKAGAHSWADTGAAFVIGTGAGFLTAALHTRTTPTPGAVPVQSSGSPLVSYGGTF